MKSTELIDELVQEYDHYRQMRIKAALRLETERVADIGVKLIATRKKLDAVMQAIQDGKYLEGIAAPMRNSRNMEDHELMLWADAGYPPVAAEPRLVEHERPRRWISPYSGRDIQGEPTAADWHRVALRYVETGSKEHYEKMLSRVRLDHPVPNLWAESETVKITGKTTRSLTPEDLWQCVKGYPLTVGAILIALLIFVIALNGV